MTLREIRDTLLLIKVDIEIKIKDLEHNHKPIAHYRIVNGNVKSAITWLRKIENDSN